MNQLLEEFSSINKSVRVQIKVWHEQSQNQIVMLGFTVVVIHNFMFNSPKMSLTLFAPEPTNMLSKSDPEA